MCQNPFFFLPGAYILKAIFPHEHEQVPNVNCYLLRRCDILSNKYYTIPIFVNTNVCIYIYIYIYIYICDWIRAGRSGDGIPLGARFSPPVQTGPGTHPAFCIMGTVSFPGVNSGRGVTLASHPLLVPWSRQSRAIPLLPLWVVRPVQSFSACTRVHTHTHTHTYTLI